MLTLHHLENSRSHRIVWLLEELGAEYQIERYPRDPETRLAPPALRQIHPLGKAPIITDGDRVIAESGAIVEYLLDNYDDGTLLPAAGSAEHDRYRYWLHYAEGTIMPLLLIALLFNSVEAKSPLLVRPIAKGIAAKVRAAYLDPNIERNLQFMEQTLSEQTWFAGERLTGADIMMSFPVEGAEVRTGLTDYPQLHGFLERVRARPAWQRAIEQAGPHDLLPRV